jgi:hypothetical protein
MTYGEYLRQRGTYPQCSGKLEAGRPLSRCETSLPGDPVFALIGDSHADHLFPGVASSSPSNWLLLSESGCPPLLGVTIPTSMWREKCAELNDVANHIATELTSVSTVVLAFRGLGYTAVASVQAVDRSDLSDAPAIFAYGLERELELLEGANRRVVLFLDVPNLDFWPAECIDIRPFRLEPQPLKPCVIAKNRAVAAQADYRRIASRLASRHPGTLVYDPFPVFCDDQWCHATSNGRLLYRDTNHLTMLGSRVVAADFVSWFERNNAI